MSRDSAALGRSNVERLATVHAMLKEILELLATSACDRREMSQPVESKCELLVKQNVAAATRCGHTARLDRCYRR